MKTYIYANSQIIAQHTGDHEADRYFYLHDRLGSVRQIIDTSGNVKNRYTYDPFGEEYTSEVEEDQNLDNVFKFTGQYFDSEIDQYYLRARQYDPHIARFTARDPVFGKFKEPLTLHAYLYCLNDPINYIDNSGKWALMIGGSLSGNFTLAGLNRMFGGLVGRSFDSMLAPVAETLGEAVSYHTIILPFAAYASEHVGYGATGGGAFVVAHNVEKAWNKGWSFGAMGWYAGGYSLSSGFGYSGTLDVGISFEAQHISHLEGMFVEFGGSIGTGAPFIPWLGINTGGFTVSISENEEIGPVILLTGSLGWGKAGAEGHLYVGKTHVWTVWEN